MQAQAQGQAEVDQNGRAFGAAAHLEATGLASHSQKKVSLALIPQREVWTDASPLNNRAALHHCITGMARSTSASARLNEFSLKMPQTQVTISVFCTWQ